MHSDKSSLQFVFYEVGSFNILTLLYDQYPAVVNLCLRVNFSLNNKITENLPFSNDYFFILISLTTCPSPDTEERINVDRIALQYFSQVFKELCIFSVKVPLSLLLDVFN
jgi:hypothetical protein